jgi:hypothetical protein
MMILLLSLVVMTGEVEKDLSKFAAEDAKYVRYLTTESPEESAVASFVLNTVSDRRKITLPTMVNKNLIRFDLRDYGILPKNYSVVKKDIYTKNDEKLKEMTGSDNPIMRADYFIIKAMTGANYRQLMDVTDLKSFRKRHSYNAEDVKKARAEQAAIVVSSGLVRTTRYIKRVATVTGSMWEAWDSTTEDYLQNLLTEKYDYMQVIAFNSNGLLSYFSADSKGNAQNNLDVNVAIDHSRSFNGDLVVRLARNCVACHTTGVLPVKDHVRALIEKDAAIIAKNRELRNRVEDLFSTKLPVERDQAVYAEALMKTTGMTPQEFTPKFVAIWNRYYKDLTLEEAAKEFGFTPDDFKNFCKISGNYHLVNLVVNGKISRVNLERVMEAK